MAWGIRGSKVLKVIKDLDPDLVLGQEINGAIHKKTITEGLRDYVSATDLVGNNDGWVKNSQVKISGKQEMLDLRGDGGADVHVIPLETHNLRFDVFNCHFPSGNFQARELVARRAANILALRKEDDPPVIILGDFNNDTYYTNGPHQVLESVGVSWMKKVVDVKNSDWAEFYSDFKPKKNSESWLSDIGVFGNGISITYAELVITDNYISDHAPLLADVKIANV